jgi:hypothetical protein
MRTLEGNKHVELVTEADEEIVIARKSASKSLASLSKVSHLWYAAHIRLRTVILQRVWKFYYLLPFCRHTTIMKKHLRC